jgi:hypothetical protein
MVYATHFATLNTRTFLLAAAHLLTYIFVIMATIFFRFAAENERYNFVFLTGKSDHQRPTRHCAARGTQVSVFSLFLYEAFTGFRFLKTGSSVNKVRPWDPVKDVEIYDLLNGYQISGKPYTHLIRRIIFF